jgi:hypothetical protein
MNRMLVPAIAAVATGVTTFLVLGANQPDRGDEFIYGLIVGALTFAIVRYALRNKRANG